MNVNKMEPEEVPSLIDKILKTNDPATVGLRRIIKRKSEEGTDFLARVPVIEPFDIPGKSRILSEDERRILELEKKVMDLEEKCRRQVIEQKKAEEVASKSGYLDGMKKGIEKGASETAAMYEKKIDTLQQEISAFLKIVENEKRSIYVNAEHLLLKLALEIAKKVVSSEIVTNQQVILNVVKKALTHISDRERVIIHVSPQDYAVVTQRKDFWDTITDNLNNIIITEDSRIEKGGCLIESNSGVVDARLGVQIDEICSVVEMEWEHAKTAVENGVDVFLETETTEKGI
ncbi:MAG TPA: FliH/SctL family protein [Chitinispirillaceae bacterium]|nr:FliH/SctL family protein [Chitinispirillaceae bacterium]